MSDANSLAAVHSLRRRVETRFARLQITFNLGKKCTEAPLQRLRAAAADIETFLSRVTIIDEDFKCFLEICQELDDANDHVEATDQVKTDQIRSAYEDMYFQVLTFRRTMENSAGDDRQSNKAPLSQAFSSPSFAKLPKIQIEPFSGSIEEWPNFYALFNSLVHKNDSIAGIEKLTYLRSLLKSHALSLIETLEITDANYAIAWEAVTKRYQNKRLLASNYLDKIYVFRPFSEGNIVNLTNFLDVFDTNLAALKALDLTNLFDFTMLHAGLRVIPDALRHEFESSVSETPSFNQLVEFIRHRVRILELAPRNSSYSKEGSNARFNKIQRATRSSPRNALVVSSEVHPPKGSLFCPVCSSAHKIYACLKFKAFDVDQRLEIVKKHSLCFSCLGFHRKSDCKSKSRCQHCDCQHHSLLHRVRSSAVHPASMTTVTNAPVSAVHPTGPGPTRSQSENPSSVQSLSCSTASSDTSTPMVILGTALVGIRDQTGTLRPVRAVIDPGSQVSLITESCVQRLRLPRYRAHIRVNGVSNEPAPNNKGIVSCSISPLDCPRQILSTQALILNVISSNQPNLTVDPSIRERFKHLKLADPSFDSSSRVDFLLGFDLFLDILGESSSVIKGQPGALDSIFGWIVGGSIQVSTPDRPVTSLLTCCESLDHSIRQFWEQEEVSPSRIVNPEDDICEDHFMSTHSRTECGRYVVRLPLKSTDIDLPDTREHALRRLTSLERRLQTQPDLLTEYHRFMGDYIEQGHMVIADAPAVYIIPHHCVQKAESSSTKLRTVFDASFPTSPNALSLNSYLMKGAKLQKDISDIISGFRLGKITVCCDIRQMYRQVLVHPDDWKFQHIYYRDKADGPIQEFALTTVTYGLSSSAFQALRVVQQLVRDDGSRFPLASRHILRQTFVDDVCSSVDSLEEALTLQRELIDLLGLGGFVLRKWSSNHPEVLKNVPQDHREGPLPLRDGDDHTLKILGIQYEPNGDHFSYATQTNPLVMTKRSMLSEIARIYDPVGWLSPLTLFAKSLIQQSWILGLDWDQELPQAIQTQWRAFVEGLPALSRIIIPRHIAIVSAPLRQIIGFCDGSTKGYGAVVYARAEAASEIKIHLVKAKGKVAPVKTMSVPRLELSAAVLLGQLVESLKPFIEDIQPTSIHLFSDSSTVLSWIRTPTHKLKTFVANRVTTVLETSLPSQWSHVRTHENPADCASRGLNPEELSTFDLWWRGPEFLWTPYESWSIATPELIPPIDLPEVKIDTLHVTRATPTLFLALCEQTSSLLKLQRLLAFALRFIHNARCSRSPDARVKGPLRVSEMKSALLFLIKGVQAAAYPKEINALKANKGCSAELQRLSPFIDECGIIRVGGRIKHSLLGFDSKHPIIIPKKSRLASLICDHVHEFNIHAGPSLTQSLVQRKYFIPSLRSLVRQRLHQCLRCFKMKAAFRPPVMADLPSCRLQPARPFTVTGIDFAGPWMIKESHRRKAPQSKGYMVVLICLTTRAIHLEFASNLSTNCVLAALDRFIARRGICQEIKSDRGTNFQGAARHFREITQFLQESNATIADHLSIKEIKWTFNPPAAPHFGGIWEAAVKSAKRHLSRILDPLILTFEEMSTLMARVEAALNSRPYVPVTFDPQDDTNYLTPGHFLIGASLLSAPELDLTLTPANRLDRFQLLQQAAQSFWNHWSRDYLPLLLPRTKWTKPQPNLQQGDVVFVKQAHCAPQTWPIGRVQEVYPGKDGAVRVVKIKTSSGVYVRPVHNLLPLPPREEPQ